jgi:hypothetical protein
MTGGAPLCSAGIYFIRRRFSLQIDNRLLGDRFLGAVVVLTFAGCKRETNVYRPETWNVARNPQGPEMPFDPTPKTKDMVLISHSIGGLLSQMQAVTTGRVLWDHVFQGDADRIYAKLPPDQVLKRALIFDANPRVQRIVFICVPHRGRSGD